MAQQNVIEKPDLHALPTISDRMTFIYLEHCKVSRENGAVTATDLDGTVYIPAAAITVLLLGPGTLFPAYAGVIPVLLMILSVDLTFPRIRRATLVLKGNICCNAVYRIKHLRYCACAV